MTEANITYPPNSNNEISIPIEGCGENLTRVCPLCQSEVRLFFINFNDKMMMCENTECEFPFGYEELQFYKEDHQTHSDEELDIQSVKSKLHTTPTCSFVSESCWLEIDKLTKAQESEDGQPFERPVELKQYTNKRINRKKVDPEQDDIKRNMEELKDLHLKLKQTSEQKTVITNENMLRKLEELKNRKSKLMKPEESEIVKQKRNLVQYEIKTEQTDKIHITIDVVKPNNDPV